MMDKIGYLNWEKITVGSADNNAKIQKTVQSLKEKINLIRLRPKKTARKSKKGDELPPGVICMVKILYRHQAQAVGG